ncbi:MAG TPA: lysylphosphatidylglycerol synthase transmembrane domain-containing protein, partial [Limnochordales bacterium]
RRRPGWAVSPQAIRRGVVISLLAGAAAVAALVALVRDGDPTIDQIRLVDPVWLGVAAGLTLGAWLLRTWRSQVLAGAFGARVPARRLFRYYLASVFVSHVTPTSAGGLPVFIYLLTREGLTAGHAAAVAVVDSGLVALFLLAAWPAAAAWKGLGFRLGAPALTAAVVASLAAVALLVAWMLVRPRAVPGLLMRWLVRSRRHPGGSRRSRRWAALLVKESLRFSSGLRYLVLRRPWHLVAATVLTGLYWGAYLSIAWAVLVGLGGRADWTYAAAAQLIFNLLQPFIPTPGGSGGAELMMAYLFRRVVPASRLAVFVAVWRLFIFYASLVVGGAMFVRSLGTAGPRGTSPRPAPAGTSPRGGRSAPAAEPPS